MRFGFSGSVVRRGALILATAVLASCTVVVDDGPPPMRPLPPRPDICPQVFDPVCGRRGPVNQTFPNACEARSEGFRVVYPGRCRGGGGGGGGWDRPPRPDRPDRPGFCTREYAPVCARRRGNERTFPNACEAESAGWRIVDRGPC